MYVYICIHTYIYIHVYTCTYMYIHLSVYMYNIYIHFFIYVYTYRHSTLGCCARAYKLDDVAQGWYKFSRVSYTVNSHSKCSSELTFENFYKLDDFAQGYGVATISRLLKIISLFCRI